MRCQACNKMLNEREARKVDTEGQHVDLCGYCLTSSKPVDDREHVLGQQSNYFVELGIKAT